MTKLWKTEITWLDKLLPDGYPTPGSTLVSGPGGSGKPLISLLFSAAWLNAGGRVAFFLTSTDRQYTERVLNLFGYNIGKHRGRFVFIDFDPQIEGVEQVSYDHIKANLLDPRAWDESLKMMERLDKGNGMDDLITSAAINLFFFSKTYADQIHAYLKDMLSAPGNLTIHMTINSDVFKPKARQLEETVDNLFMTRMEQPMRLFMQIRRMKGVSFVPDEIQVPLAKNTLMEIKQEAERGRRDLIPTISRL